MKARVQLAVLSVVLGLCVAAPAGADPVSLTATHFDWKLPFPKPLRLNFSSTPVPGYEALRLPTFNAESVWFEQGRLSLLTFTRVSPGVELDCARLCQPLLDTSLGAEARFELGGAGVVPESHLFLRGERGIALPIAAGGAQPRGFSRLTAGFAGLLDF